MNYLSALYKESLVLMTDFYQLTMASGYFHRGMENKEAVFNLFFRKEPYSGGYTVAAGLNLAIDFLNNFRFSEDDIHYLSGLKSPEGDRYFSSRFLEYLGSMTFSCDIDAQTEGSLIFPHEPVVRVKGPLAQCQLLETPLLTLIGHCSLIATKASRITAAAKGEPVMEFGLRRSHGFDGGLAASLASYIGGCHSTSNVLAGKLYDIPVSGTHAHSWVMAFDNELESFQAYADSMPFNCVLLVDTFDTLEGVKNAIRTGHELKKSGHSLKAIRIDSGDLAYLSIRAREMLDQAGLTETKIVGSNDLDEYLITSLKEQGAKISMWGVGTKLATSFDQPALGAVYKLTAIKNEKDEWEDKIKLSEQVIKINIPGVLQVKRFYQNGKMAGDMIYDERDVPGELVMIAPDDYTKQKKFRKDTECADLLHPIFRKGQQVYEKPPFKKIRDYHQQELQRLDPSSRRLTYPHLYPVGLEKKLFERRASLILKNRKLNPD